MMWPSANRILLLCAATAAGSAPHGELHKGVPDPEAGLVVRINPEERVDVEEGALPSRSVMCAEDFPLRVKILNEGRATAPLDIRLVEAPVQSLLTYRPAPLTGQAEEWRTLQIRPGTVPTDLTFAVSLRGEGEGARTHLLIKCSGGISAAGIRD